MGLTNKQEWLLWRRAGLGASDAAILYGKSPYKNRYDLFLEKTSTGEIKENGNFITDKGHELEPIIRKRWALIASLDLGIDAEWLPENVDSGGRVMRASLDGTAPRHEIIAEFKFQGGKAHEDVKNGLVPEHYWIQVQHQLLVSGAKKAYLVSYNDKLDSANYHEILPDVQFHNEHIRVCKAFWKEVLEKSPSELTLSFKKEIKTEKSDFLKTVASDYVQTQKAIKVLEERLDALKQDLINANGTADKTDFEFVTVTKATRSGSINYKDIPEVKLMSKEYLNNFKAKDTEYFLVKAK